MKTESNPARTECGNATNLKSFRICVERSKHIIGEDDGWYAPRTLIGEDDDLDEETGVEEEKEGGHPRLQMSGLLSPSMAPQRDGCELAQKAFAHLPNGEALQMVAGLEEEKEEMNCYSGNWKQHNCCQSMILCANQAEGSDAENGRQDEDWCCGSKKAELSLNGGVAAEQVL